MGWQTAVIVGKNFHPTPVTLSLLLEHSRFAGFTGDTPHSHCDGGETHTQHPQRSTTMTDGEDQVGCPAPATVVVLVGVTLRAVRGRPRRRPTRGGWRPFSRALAAFKGDGCSRTPSLREPNRTAAGHLWSRTSFSRRAAQRRWFINSVFSSTSGLSL